MESYLLFRIFELTTAIFDIFISYQFIEGFFEKKKSEEVIWPYYFIYCIGHVIINLWFNSLLVLVFYTIISMYILILLLYNSGISARIIGVFYFSAIMIGTEVFVSWFISGVWHITLTSALKYGMPRVLAIVIAKLLQLLLVKLSVVFFPQRTNKEEINEYKLTIPLFLCQLFSIFITHNLFMVFGKANEEITPLALISMVGIIYINLIIFWYFDRIKAVFSYKSKSEAFELKAKLQRQYLDNIAQHQKETDALWHDMRKHIDLMKVLLNNGHDKVALDYIREVETQMGETIHIVRTAHPVLSALLTEQKKKAEAANITFSVKVKLGSSIRISPVELCIILGNLFDNAMEACLALPPDSKPFITTFIAEYNGAVDIRMMNSYCHDLKPQVRPGKHGIGQKNIRNIVNQHDGKMTISAKDGVYSVSITVP